VQGARRPTRRTGADVPVLVVTGVGMAAAARLRTLPVLAERFRVLPVHVRRASRIGGSGAIAGFADEAVSVLDAAGADRALVYGVSFGGLVAQEMALRHPDRVHALVLAATSAGGDLRVPPDEDARDFMERRSDMPAEEALWAAVPYSYGLATRRRRRAGRIGEDIAARLRRPVDPAARRAQRDAALAHDAAGRLRPIDVPTLVVHGEEDRLVPPENGRLLADAIPLARLLLVPGAGHVYPTDEPEADRAIVRFLLERRREVARRARSDGGRAARA
jgi:3-oxoadipate enol-lactonase